MADVSLKDIKINRGLVVTVSVAAAMFPSYLFLRVFFGRFFAIHDHLELIFIAIGIGMTISICYAATLFLALDASFRSEEDWVKIGLMSAFLTTCTLISPALLMAFIGEKIAPELAVRTVALVAVGLNILLHILFYRDKKLKQKKTEE